MFAAKESQSYFEFSLFTEQERQVSNYETKILTQ